MLYGCIDASHPPLQQRSHHPPQHLRATLTRRAGFPFQALRDSGGREPGHHWLDCNRKGLRGACVCLLANCLASVRRPPVTPGIKRSIYTYVVSISFRLCARAFAAAREHGITPGGLSCAPSRIECLHGHDSVPHIYAAAAATPCFLHDIIRTKSSKSQVRRFGVFLSLATTLA